MRNVINQRWFLTHFTFDLQFEVLQLLKVGLSKLSMQNQFTFEIQSLKTHMNLSRHLTSERAIPTTGIDTKQLMKFGTHFTFNLLPKI